MAAMLRQGLPILVARRRLALAVGASVPAAASWQLLGLKAPGTRLPAPSACDELRLVPVQEAPRVTLLQLVCRFFQLGFWLLPISAMLCLGLVGKDSTSEMAPALLVRCLQQCGPTFVKLGQWLATRRDLFSDPCCRRLAELHEEVPLSFTVEEEELKRRCNASGLPLAALDDRAPIGAGCVSQVYRGELEDGRVVAVKLRRPHIDRQVAVDIALFRLLGSFVESVRSDLRWLSVRDGIDNFGTHLRHQLDFRVEARNLLRFGENFRRDRFIRVPEVHHAADDILVTSFVGGSSLSEILSPERGGAQELGDTMRVQLWTVLGSMVSKMIFADNFVHQDLHPGNIRITFRCQTEDATSRRSRAAATPNGSPSAHDRLRACVESARDSLVEPLRAAGFRVGGAPFEVHLLDAGLALSIQDCKMAFFSECVKHSVTGHVDACGRAFLTIHERLGLAEFGIAKDRFVTQAGRLAASAMLTQKGCWRSLGFESENEYLNARLGGYFGRMAQLFSEHRIRMDHEIWSLLNSFALIEGSMYELNGSTNVLRCVLPYVFDIRSLASLFQAKSALSASESASS